MDDFLSNNVDWLLLIVAYALERLQEVKRRKKLKSESVVETDGNSKVKGKAAKVAGFLFDLLPIASRLKRRR